MGCCPSKSSKGKKSKVQPQSTGQSQPQANGTQTAGPKPDYTEPPDRKEKAPPTKPKEIQSSTESPEHKKKRRRNRKKKDEQKAASKGEETPPKKHDDTPVQKEAPKGRNHFQEFPSPKRLADAQRKEAEDDAKNDKKKKKSRTDKKTNQVPPFPTPTTKNSFFKVNEYEEVDAFAMEVPQSYAREPLKNLVDHLSAGKDDKAKVRAFYVWIGAQDLLNFDLKDPILEGCALYYLLRAHSGTATLNDLLAEMCRNANIRVEMVRGAIKSPEHRIGSTPVSGYKWCAMYIDDSWRLIDQDAATGYVIKASDLKNTDFPDTLPDHLQDHDSLFLSPRRKPNDQLTLAKTPRTNASPAPKVTSSTPRNAGIASLKDVVLTQERNDFFFFPDPEQFIYDHCAEDPEWQLLARWVTLQEFTEMASLDEDFFENGLLDTSEPRGIARAQDGQWQLALTTHPKSHFRLSHHLIKIKGDKTKEDLNAYVYTENAEGGKIVRIHFKEVGIYLLSLYATDTQSQSHMEPVRVARYIIECDKPAFGVQPNPDNPRGEYGPGAEMVAAGIEPLTHKTGTVFAQLGIAVIRFKCNCEPYEFTHFLESNEIRKSQLSALSRHYHIAPEVVFVAKLPKAGKYLFRIYGQPYGQNGAYANICNYLVISDIGCLDDTPFPAASHGQVGLVAKDPSVVLYPVSHPVPIVRDIETGSLHLTMSSSCELELSPQMDLQGEDFREDLSEYVWYYTVPEESKIEVDLRFPRAGTYSLNLYGRPVKAVNSTGTDAGADNVPFQDLFKYVLMVDQPHTHCFAVPGKHVAWEPHYQIKSPQDGYLLPKTKYPFSVQIPHAEEVGILSHSWSTIPLTKRPSNKPVQAETNKNQKKKKEEPELPVSRKDEDWWEGEVDSGPGGRNITLVARFPNQTTYTYLLEFQVLESKEMAKIRREQEEADKEARSRMKRMDKERKSEQAEVDYQNKQRAALIKKHEEEHEERKKDIQEEMEKYRWQRQESWKAAAEAERSKLEQSQRVLSKEEEVELVTESVFKLRMMNDSGNSYYRKRYQGMKTKMAREQMREATRLRDRQMLQAAIAAFEQQRLAEQDKDLTNAKRMLNTLIAKEMLDEAKADMDMDGLQKALDYIRKRNLHGHLQTEVREAERLLHQLQKADQLKYSVLNMDRTTISEMRSYQRPPDVVRKVMTATLLVLGEDEHTTKEWTTVQRICGCLGHEGLNRRILELEVEDLHPEIVARVNQICQPLKHSQVQMVSAGAAAFHVWLMGTVDAWEKIHTDRESRRAKPADVARQREIFGKSPISSEVKTDVSWE